MAKSSLTKMLTVGVIALSLLALVNSSPIEGEGVETTLAPASETTSAPETPAPTEAPSPADNPTTQPPQPPTELPTSAPVNPTTTTPANFSFSASSKPCLMATLMVLGLTIRSIF